jgi:membrane associated rhomboid family serine protease
MSTPTKSAPAHTTSTSSVPASARVHPTTVKAAVKVSTLNAVPASARVHPTTTHVPASGAKSTVLGYLVLHKRSQHSNTLSTGAIVIAVIAALLVLACIGWALARRRAFEPHWLLSLRHAMAEAGFRVSATWAEFADWVRLGH